METQNTIMVNNDHNFEKFRTIMDINQHNSEKYLQNYGI